MYALILVIYIQGAQSSTPRIDRLEISPQRIESAQACCAAR